MLKTTYELNATELSQITGGFRITSYSYFETSSYASAQLGSLSTGYNSTTSLGYDTKLTVNPSSFDDIIGQWITGGA